MKVLLRGFLAGMAISIGGWLYLASRSASVSLVLPAFLFSLGLMSICAFDFHLYTGRVCYLFSNNEVSFGKRCLKLALALFGNLLGCLVFGYLCRFLFKPWSTYSFNVLEGMVNTKLTYHWYEMLLRSFLCGIMVFIAVDGYKKIEGFGRFFIIALAIGGFIIMGFEHSIANMFYFFCNNTVSGKMALYLLLCVIGNSLGGLFLPLIYLLIGKFEKKEIEEEKEGN